MRIGRLEFIAGMWKLEPCEECGGSQLGLRWHYNWFGSYFRGSRFNQPRVEHNYGPSIGLTISAFNRDLYLNLDWLLAKKEPTK